MQDNQYTTSSCDASGLTGDLWCAVVVNWTCGESPHLQHLSWDRSPHRGSGTYCLLVVATLLDLLTPELLHNVDKFISACQTYEGGFACSSFPFPSLGEPTSRAAMAEAHGGYTSCALNSHFLLASIRPPDGCTSLEPDFPSPIDIDGTARWSALMQGESIEGGGLRGRSNKLVDGCYSWWVGGGVPVIEALSNRQRAEKRRKKESEARIVLEESEEGDWEDTTGTCCSAEWVSIGTAYH